MAEQLEECAPALCNDMQALIAPYYSPASVLQSVSVLSQQRRQHSIAQILQAQNPTLGRAAHGKPL